MNEKRKHVIRILLGITLIGLIISWIAGNQFIFKFTDSPLQLFDDVDFIEFALILSVLFEALPSVAKQFVSVGALNVRFLQSSTMNPLVFTAILSAGQLAGQMGLYGLGMVIKKVKKGSIGDLASKSHFLEKHHFLIYAIVPFAGVLGDAVVLYSGHERINPLKMIPFLYASNFVDNLKHVYMTVGQLELEGIFN